MRIGEAFFIPPWALFFDAHEDLWISNFDVEKREGFGTCCMRVDKTEDGYFVSLPSECQIRGGDPIRDSVPVARLENADWSDKAFYRNVEFLPPDDGLQ